MISIAAIGKRFPGNTANSLDGLTLDVAKGTFFTLFGPSGCGKSTLLRCLAGLETPDAGEISIDGMKVFSADEGLVVPPNKRRLSMVFQSYAIWPHMTVLENVTFPLEVRREDRAKERARTALDIVGLSAFEGRYASRLSGGQQQRVALARAIVADPSVLLLDEPLSNLDAALRDHMRGELLSLQRRIGVTTVYVTHDQTEALSMSDRIAVMSEGKFVEIGTPDDLFYRPRSAFTARLIGGANVLKGTAKPGPEGLTAVETPAGTLLSADKASGPVDVFVRPDRIEPAGADAPAINLFEAQVRERRFAGESTEFDVVPQGTEHMLRSRMPTSRAPGAGGALRLRIDPADVRIFAA
ncbi:MAG: ABC transporter ATP-binding protein [Proteobacteria bacterium]|nr:ABC transporter ATP-binding protein [Pseudomonadota bacterium]